MFNKQKKYFRDKLKGVEKMIWDLEFKKFKTKEIREEIRQIFDTNKAKLQAAQERYKKEEKAKKLNKDEMNRIDDDIVRLKKDIERNEGQLKSLDLEIYGSKPTAEYPQGVQGIDDQLEGLYELISMIKTYIKRDL